MTSEEAVLFKSLNDQLLVQSQTVTSQVEVIKKLNARLKELQSQISWFQRQFFGRKSEKLAYIDPNQLNIQFDDIDINTVNKEIEEAGNQARKQIAKEKIPVKKKEPHRNRKILYEDLPIIQEILEPKEKVDLTVYKKIGEEHTKTLEFVPGRLYVKDLVRIKYGLKNPMTLTEKGKGVLIAPMPPMPIYKGLPGYTLLAELCLMKYEYHIPFYRVRKIFKHLDIEISENTVNGWFIRVCELLKPLYLELRKIVLSTNYIQVDETTIPVINNETHKAAKKYLWMVRSVMEHLVFFHYDKGSRSQQTAIKLLKSFKGYLQSDGYSAYNIFGEKKDICLISCLAHIRRYWSDSLEENKKYAEEGLKQIRDLYRVEKIADRDGLSYDQRAALRQKLSKPIMNGFELWLKKIQPQVLPKSRIGKAINYSLNMLPRQRPCLELGNLLIDNNLGENAIRPICLGRKNFLFCGNDGAAENMAIICSLLSSCKDCNVNPREYLNDIIARMPYYLEGNSGLNLRDLLPDKWTPDSKIVQKNTTKVQQLYTLLSNPDKN